MTLTKKSFKNVFFVESMDLGDGIADLQLNDVDRTHVRVVDTYCDVVSFDNEDYDGDSGVYESGFMVILSTDESESVGEFLHANAFRELWQVVEYVNHRVCPEGYVYCADERGEW